jgi:hypothetical protein
MEEEVDVRPHGEIQFLGYFGYSTVSGVIENATHAGLFAQAWSKAGVYTAFPDEVANRALLKARLKVKNSTINLAQTMAEVGQTAGFVANTVDNIAELVWAFRNRNFIQWRKFFTEGDVPRHVLREIQQRWLELQYAIRPLMGDIHGAVTSLDEAAPYQVPILSVKASSGTKVEQTVSWDVPGSDSHLDHYQADVFMLHSSKVRIDCVPVNAAFITAARLGLTNPAALSWELTRMSFVIDWFYPLGNYFSQFDALLGYQVLGYSMSNLTKVTSKARGMAYTKSDGYPVTQKWEGRYELTRLGRDARGEVPFAELPSVKNPFSASHVMSSLALLSQALRKHGWT